MPPRSRVWAKGAFDDLSPPSHSLLADVRAQADTVGVDGRAPRLVAVPTREGLTLRLGNPRRPGAAIERLQHGARMVSFVGDALGWGVLRRCLPKLVEVCFRHRQSAGQRGRVTLVSRVDFR